MGEPCLGARGSGLSRSGVLGVGSRFLGICRGGSARAGCSLSTPSARSATDAGLPRGCSSKPSGLTVVALRRVANPSYSKASLRKPSILPEPALSPLPPCISTVFSGSVRSWSSAVGQSVTVDSALLGLDVDASPTVHLFIHLGSSS
jgi:hypothetical protein